jgi:hypothetical protein
MMQVSSLNREKPGQDHGVYKVFKKNCAYLAGHV